MKGTDRAERDRGYRVLVVDDNEAIHRLVAQRLHGLYLMHVYSGWEARIEAARERIDVVLLGLNLPDTTGLDLLEEGFGTGGPPVVVMFSMDARPSLAERARQLGAADYLEKSAENFLMLRARLERLVRGSSVGDPRAR